MSTTVSQNRINLARKYRPKTLSELIGQSSITTILSEALKRDRIAPAYLLSGPRGVGKTSTARIFAKAASCMSDDLASRPCGKCKACIAFQDSQNMDIMEIDGASHTGVDDVRRIIESIAYRPSVGKRNIYIIDEVHMLSNAAFNALLKTLEEPPSHALFLFATTEAEKIPSTILSRVQRLELRRLSEKLIIESLKNICKKEGIEASDTILEQIAAAADGALRDAQTLLEQMILLSGSMKVSSDVVDSFLGTIGSEAEIEFLSLIAKKEIKALLEKVQLFFEKGKDLVKLNSRLVLWMRALLITKASASPELVGSEIVPEHLTKLLQSYEGWSIEDCDRLFEVLWKSHDRMKYSDLPLISFETAMIKATRIAHTEDIFRLMEKLDTTPAPVAAQQNLQTKESAFEAPRFVAPSENPSVVKKKAPIVTSKPITSKDISSQEKLLEAIKAVRPSLWALVKCAEKIEISDSQIEVILPKSHFAFAQLTERLMKTELEKVLNQLAGKSIDLQISENETLSPPKAAKRTDFIKEAKQKILKDEEIQEAVQILGGKISSVTVEGIKT